MSVLCNMGYCVKLNPKLLTTPTRLLLNLLHSDVPLKNSVLLYGCLIDSGITGIENRQVNYSSALTVFMRHVFMI